MNIKNHWLSQATQILSPNFDLRPVEKDISLLVIHCISLPPNEFGGDYIDQLFCNQLDPNDHEYFREVHVLKVSSHLLIKRDGNIVQYIPFNKRAWHAGASSYKNRTQCNDYSIGIELEGTETVAYTDKQYEQLAKAIKALLHQYPTLSTKQITGHCHIAPDRKKDPGESFDWARLSLALQE
jgi:AmpD protein